MICRINKDTYIAIIYLIFSFFHILIHSVKINCVFTIGMLAFKLPHRVNLKNAVYVCERICVVPYSLDTKA